MRDPTIVIATAFAELVERSVWVAWKAENGKKVPYNPHTGRRAKSDTVTTWGTLAEAQAVSPSAGVGLMLTDRKLCNNVLCVDLDGCRDPETGELAGWAKERIERLDSYSEVSPSGTGVKVFCVAGVGNFPDAKHAMGKATTGKQPGIELFAGGGSRFVAVTGQHLPNTPMMLRTLTGEEWNSLEPRPAKQVLVSEPAMAELVEEALRHLDAADSDTWQKVTQALSWAAREGELDPDRAHQLWTDWSKAAPDRFDERGNESRWRSFRREEGRVVRLGTLFHLAREAGWKGSRFSSMGFPDLTKDGGLRVTVPNTMVALEVMGVEIKHDLFKLRDVVRGQPIGEFAGDVQDRLLLRLCEIMHEKFGFRPSTGQMLEAVQSLGNHHRFHPVRDYLDGLEWDGVRRIDTWLVDYGGAEDTEFNRAVGAIFLMAAVRRVREPGCKFDEILVLESEQGRNKSQAIETLAKEQEWFTDQSPLGRRDKEVIELIAGRWIVEIAELKGMRNSEIEATKAFASRRVDSARMAYALTTTDAPRQCVFFATTNDDQYLRDRTGNRRFWPVRVERFDIDVLRRDRDQLWAEASVRERAGAGDENLIRLPEKLWAAAEQQEGRLVENPFHAPLYELLGPFDTGKIRSTQLMDALELFPGRYSQQQLELVADAMRTLGWRKPDNKGGKLRFGGGNPANGWVRGEGPEFRLVVIEPPRRDEGMRYPPVAYYDGEPPPSGIPGQD